MSENMKEIQNKILKLYKQVLPLLEKYKIKFTANGGTCIGACREKGFIEWDDDLDINIIPEDFDKMMDLFNNLPEDLYWKKHSHGVYKILSRRLTHKNEDVFIDLMALSYVKKPGKIRNIYNLALTAHFFYNRNKYSNGQHAKWYFKWPIVILSFWFPTRLSDFLLQKSFKSKKQVWSSQITNVIWYKNSLQKNELFTNRELVPFEDTYIYVPKDYDKYLTKAFGDWKTPLNTNRIHY